MELFNKYITNGILYLIDKLNYSVYKLELVLVILGIIAMGIIIHYVQKDNEKYLFRYELNKCLKMLILVIISGYLVKELDISTIKGIFNTIFYNLMPITVIGVVVIYAVDRLIFYKSINISDYINIMIVVTYIFLLISCSYEVKDLLVPIIYQIILISIRFELINRSSDKIDDTITLYPSREKQLDILIETIEGFDSENYAIALNGEWGSGKTVLIKSLINRMKGKNNYYIYIKPMLSDSRESLIKEFKLSLSKVMNSAGINNGINGTVDRYFNEVLNLIQFNTKVSLGNLLIKDDKYDTIRELKEELQKDINNLLNNYDKKLLIIIDDFDRVDENKQLEILSFIKEVVDFEGCVTLIALDYKNLKGNNTVNNVYLEKFIANQIDLIDLDFNEIIKFHYEEILKEDVLENQYSKDILQKIKDNIYDYYNNIIERLNKYFTAQRERIDKEKPTQEQKDNEEKKLKEFFGFAMNQGQNVNNSRRIIHFLKEIQNTIIIVDKLYKGRDNNEEFLSSINASEIIYFINYVKIFNRYYYDKIIESGGVEGYYISEKIDKKQLEQQYLNIILGDIIPKESYFKLGNYEQNDLKRKNSLDFIRDVFIDYFFCNNNLELLTDSQKYVSEIDKNDIQIVDNWKGNLEKYQKSIFLFNNDLELTKKRINILIQYSLKLLDNKKINFIDIIEMADSKKNNWDVFYSKYYLKAAEEVLCTKESIKLYKKDRDKVDSILKDIERDNIIKYKYVFVEIINILLIKKCVDVEIDNMLNDIYDSKELFRKIREYCVSNNLIDKENNIKTLVELFSTLIEKLENNHYQVIDIELLKKRFNEFYENAKYINKIRESEVFSNVNLRKIEDQNQYFYIENEEEIGIYLKNLSQEKQIEYENMVFFQRLIKYIVENNIKVNKEEKEFILDIYKKMNRKELINDYQWFDILVNIERTLNEDSI